MTNNILEKLFEITEKKFSLNREIWEKVFPWRNIEKWLKWETYLDSIEDEVIEVKSELRLQNRVYLEDELWDILWTYVNMLYCFEKEWYISKDKVLKKCFKKYSERTMWMENHISWEEIKEKQKKELESEHKKMYKS